MKKQLVLLVFLLSAVMTYSQKIKVKEGNIENLKGVDEYNVVFDYSNVQIPGYDTEELFLEDKMAKREEKLIGDGERFKKSWFDDRNNLYEPYFIKYFNEYFIMKRKINIEKNRTSSKYTMLVKTGLIYSGYNIGVFAQNSKLEATITIYETSTPGNILFSTKTIFVQGKASYNGGVRIANTYGILGKAFARYLRRRT